jgi:hypothetical protein
VDNKCIRTLNTTFNMKFIVGTDITTLATDKASSQTDYARVIFTGRSVDRQTSLEQ